MSKKISFRTRQDFKDGTSLDAPTVNQGQMDIIMSRHGELQKTPFKGLVDWYLLHIDSGGNPIYIVAGLDGGWRSTNRRRSYRTLWAELRTKRFNKSDVGEENLSGPMTRDYRITVIDRLKRDLPFRQAMLTEAAELYAAKDYDVCRSLLRDLVTAVIGIDALALIINLYGAHLAMTLNDKENKHIDRLGSIVTALSRHESFNG